MSKALLVVSFGTSYLDTMGKTIEAVENALAAHFPDRKLYRAFTSGMIIAKLKKEGILSVDTVEEALDRILADGADDLLIQTTHIINGEEYDLMCEAVERRKDRFTCVRIGKPLLTEVRDYEALTKVISDEMPAKQDGHAIVLMGHGSEHFANSAYAQLSYMLGDMGRTDIIVGTVEGYPGFEQITHRLAEIKDARQVDCYPLLIVAGDHARNDMSGDEPDSWKMRLTKLGYKVTCHLKGMGEYKGIRDIFAEHAEKACEV